MFTNTTFEFDGQKSTDYGLLLVNLETGVRNAPFGIGRSIIEEKIPNKPTPYFYGLNEDPLVFTVTLVREEEWDIDTRLGVSRWLFQDKYKPFISTDNVGVVYNCMAVDRPEKILVGNVPRLIEITFRCDAPWAWSPTYVSQYDLSNNNTITILNIANQSNINKYYRPEIQFKTIEAGDVTLKNLSDGGREFKFTGLSANETIYTNNELRQLETDIPSVYRLNNFNRNWFRLNYGINQIQVTGKILLTLKMKFPIAV